MNASNMVDGVRPLPPVSALNNSSMPASANRRVNSPPDVLETFPAAIADLIE